MKTILVTGSNGQLGRELREISEKYNYNFIFTDIGELDIANLQSLNNFFSVQKIDFLINCAAYTAVEKAEVEIEKAFSINSHAVSNLATLSNRFNFKIIHISTDYVFDGNKISPYHESDKTNPLNVYGKSKLLGEQEIIQKTNNYLIIRTSWLYSSYGTNFVKMILKLASERESLGIVIDQIGTPTYAKDLALLILSLINKNEEAKGLYHFSNLGTASWYDFAHYFLRKKNLSRKLKPILSSEFPSKAQRPAYSVLSKSKITNDFNFSIRHWTEALEECLEKI